MMFHKKLLEIYHDVRFRIEMYHDVRLNLICKYIYIALITVFFLSFFACLTFTNHIFCSEVFFNNKTVNVIIADEPPIRTAAIWFNSFQFATVP